MGYAQTAADYLARAGQEMSFPGLALGPDNAIDLILKSGVHLGIRLDPDSGALHLWSQLFEQPDLLPPKLLSTMLEANFLWQGTRGAVLTVGDGAVALLRRLDLGRIAYDDFRTALESFLTVAEHYARACAVAADAPAAAAAPSRAAFEPPWLMIRG
jgi:hypothetical protein